MAVATNRKIIRVGVFSPGVRIYVQECRKCGAIHKSTHVLFVCQNREEHCNGTMTAVSSEKFEDACRRVLMFG